MTRNLKALGLALMAMFALGALATSASANVKGFESKNKDTIITGTSDEGGAGSSTGTQTFDRGSTGPAIVCHHVEFDGTVTGTGPVGGWWQTDTVELEADYTTTTCTGPLNSEVHVDFTTNECGYHFTMTSGTTVDPKLICKKAGGVLITPTLGGSSLCTITVPAQGVDGHVILHNEDATTDITGEATVSGIDSTRVGNAACGAAAEADGTYIGNVTLEGFADQVNHKNTPVEIRA